MQAKLAGLAAVSDVTLLNRLRDAEGWLRQLCELPLREQGVDLQADIAAAFGGAGSQTAFGARAAGTVLRQASSLPNRRSSSINVLG